MSQRSNWAWTRIVPQKHEPHGDREREREKLDQSASKLCSYIGNISLLATTDAVLWLCQHTLRKACSLCDSLLWSGHHNLFFSWSRKVFLMLTSMLTAVLASCHGQWCIWTLHRGHQQVFQRCPSLHKGQDPSIYMADGHVHTDGDDHKYPCELSGVSVGSGAEEQLQAETAAGSQLQVIERNILTHCTVLKYFHSFLWADSHVTVPSC